MNSGIPPKKAISTGHMMINQWISGSLLPSGKVTWLLKMAIEQRQKPPSKKVNWGLN